MVLGQEIRVNDAFDGMSPILLPMVICGLGIVFSIVGFFFITIKDEKSSVQNALNIGNWASMILTVIASYFVVMWMLPEGQIALRTTSFNKNGVFAAIVVGTIVGAIMSIVTEYYTAMGKKPVNSIIQQSSTGHATNIIAGLSVGMKSTVIPILTLAGGIIASYYFAGLYGVAIAAAGMMATTAMSRPGGHRRRNNSSTFLLQPVVRCRTNGYDTGRREPGVRETGRDCVDDCQHTLR
jgi:K(+)-stimulated pyrophosphate-energized sodium pump